MAKISAVLTGLVGLIHVYFFYLEAFLWTTPRGLKAFSMTLEQAQLSATLASNQGVYNLVLGIGLLFCAFYRKPQAQLLHGFLLLMVFVVGVYGALSFAPKIFYIQALPALVAGAFSFKR